MSLVFCHTGNKLTWILNIIKRLTLFVQTNYSKHYYIYDGYCIDCSVYLKPFCVSFDHRLMESGLLPADKAKKVLEKKLQKSGKFSSPVKSAASTPRISSKSVAAKKEVKPSSGSLPTKKKVNDSKPSAKKRKKDSDEENGDSDEDFLVSRVAKKARAK